MLFPLDQHLPSLPAIDCHSKREEIFAPGNNDLHTVRPFSAKPVIGRAFARSAGHDGENPMLPA
jgi:hypothetical protein